ncbi:MAG: hypothetical protein ABW007_27675 [Chitinophagaceae bacterium]
MIEVLAPDINRVVENALLYTNKKAIRLQEVFFVVNDGKFQVFACDDYIAVGDWFEIDSKDSKEFALSVEDAEKFLAFIKKDKKVVHKSTIKVQFYSTYVKLTSDDEAEKFEYTEPSYDAWDLVFQMLAEEDQDLKPVLEFAVRPDRWAKMAQLKADKEAPLVFRGIDINGFLLLQFKKGLSLIGAAMPIDMSYVQEEFLWKNSENTEA